MRAVIPLLDHSMACFYPSTTVSASARSAPRLFGMAVALMLAVWVGSCGYAAVGAAGRPNVILIVTDDQGYADMGCHGNPFVATPHLDRLHDESVRLADFHVDPTCSPTRAALLTGRYAARTGVWLTYAGRNYPRREEVMIAEVFRAQGYRTAVFGKWHLGDEYPFRPQDRGFETSLVHRGGVFGETPDYWGNDYYDDVYDRNGRPERVQGYCTDVWFREAIRFLDADDDAPAFIYLATNAPHGPLHVPLEEVRPYLEAGIPERRARFYGMIASIDRNLGRLREHLRRTGRDRDTLLVFLNDNGTTFGVTLNRDQTSDPHPSRERGWNAGMRGIKGSAWEGGHRAACFIHWPGGGFAEGRDITELTAHIDLMPTLIELCGLQPPRGVAFDGRSLVPLLRGERDGWSERTLVVHDQSRFGEPVGEGRMIRGKEFAVMRGRWRLVGRELFNLLEDPGQRHDVARAYPQLAAELAAAYDAWWASVSSGNERHNPIVIDPSIQQTVTLTAQGWSGDTVPYSQEHVRTDIGGNGFWDVEIARAGRYAFELRRWPRELDLPLSAAPPPPPHDPARHERLRTLDQPTGVVEAVRGWLKVGDTRLERPVDPKQTGIRFVLELPAGRFRVW
ncbi:MAG: N-acetylgalactosamine-4-sulfatase, partial [Verrucomicrobia bacterium]